MNTYLKISAVVAAMAVAVPAGAAAKRPEDKPAKAPKAKVVTVNVKGVVAANDGSTMTVTVDKASGHAKACKGKSLSFDVSNARVHSSDNDADGDVDALDVLVGHAVKVQGKVALTKGRKVACSVPEGTVLPARQVHDRTTPEPEKAEEEAAEES